MSKDFRKVWTFDELMAPKEVKPQWIEPQFLPKSSKLLLGGQSKVGKAQPLDSKILTPSGWTTMGSLKVGDYVTGHKGPVKVISIHPQGRKQCFYVSTSDGGRTECCGDHLWTIGVGWNKKIVTTDTESVVKYLNKSRRNGYLPIPVCEYDNVELPVKPYTLGVLLGDGGLTVSVSLTSADPEIIDRVEAELPDGVYVNKLPSAKYQYSFVSERGECNPLKDDLSDLGLMGKKSNQKNLPEIYLRSSVSDRMELLRGILDTDGCICGTGNVSLSLTSESLLDSIVELVRSLGGTATKHSRITYFNSHGFKKAGLRSYRTSIKIPYELGSPFHLSRKRDLWVSKKVGLKKNPTRRIISIEKSRISECQCITVDSTDGLYVTDDFIVTHNSFTSMEIARALATGTPVFRSLKFPVTGPCKVFLCDKELGSDSLGFRLGRYFATSSPEELALAKQNIVAVTGHPEFYFDAAQNRATIRKELKAVRPNVLIIDPVSKFMSGSDQENDDVRRFLAFMDTLIEEHAEDGMSIVMSHHFKKPATDYRGNEIEPLNPYNFRGGSRWYDDMDSLITMRRHDVNDYHWRLECQAEFRHGASPPDYWLDVRPEAEYPVLETANPNNSSKSQKLLKKA